MQNKSNANNSEKNSKDKHPEKADLVFLLTLDSIDNKIFLMHVANIMKKQLITREKS